MEGNPTENIPSSYLIGYFRDVTLCQSHLKLKQMELS